MKFFKSILLTAVIVTLIGLPGCNKDEIKSKEEIELLKLSARPWQIHSVVVDGTDHTTLYPGLTLSFSKGTFAATNGSAAWPPTGTWEFKDKDATIIQRGDGIEVTIEQLTANELSLSMEWNETSFGPGRKKSVSGNHVFTFN